MRRFLVGVAISLMALPVFFAPVLAAEPVQQVAKKIYCAGPLFTAKEKEEMGQIARLLEKSGFRVFLPHRDGIQFASLLDSFIANGVPRPKAVEILNKAIFYLDVFQVLDSDGLILNMNGRVPDEGAIVEAGIAWQAGKTIVIYKDDARSLVDGNDNPLIMGLTGFKKLRDINEIPQVFKTHFAAGLPDKCADSGSKALVAKGWQILEIVSSQKGAAEVARAIMRVLDE
jgi:nucleoside 2-deoxyribosyltransferase